MRKESTLKIFPLFAVTSSHIEYKDLQSVSSYFETFRCFTNFPFTKSETMGDYYLKSCLTSLPNDLRLRILGN